MHKDYESPVKSVGHGITCNKDVDSEEEAWLVLLALSQDIGHRLRIHDLAAGGVQLTVKDKDLEYRQCQAQLRIPTQSPLEIAQEARRLLHCNYRWDKPVRALTVRGIEHVTTVNFPLYFNEFSQKGCILGCIPAMRKTCLYSERENLIESA
jgi:DNA polymerase-4